MIVLDTNVISELLRPEPDLRVLEWVWRCCPRDVDALIYWRRRV